MSDDAVPAAMQKVHARYRRFREEPLPARQELLAHLKDQQGPQILFIICSNSRIDPDLISAQSRAGLPRAAPPHAESARRSVAESAPDRTEADRTEAEQLEEKVLAQIGHLETHPSPLRAALRGCVSEI